MGNVFGLPLVDYRLSMIMYIMAQNPKISIKKSRVRNSVPVTTGSSSGRSSVSRGSVDPVAGARSGVSMGDHEVRPFRGHMSIFRAAIHVQDDTHSSRSRPVQRRTVRASTERTAAR